MIDYAERVGEVAELVRKSWGVDDRQLVDALLAARIECQLTYPWLVLETDWYSMKTDDAWFSFGLENNRPRVASVYRTRHARTENRMAEDELFSRNRPLCIVDPEWDRIVTPRSERYMWKQLMRNFVHIRSRYPRRPLPDAYALGKLKLITEKALDTRFRSASPKSPTDPPNGIFYWAELTQKLAINLDDWHLLLKNLYALAARRAYLYNREQTDEEDWALAMRVLCDSVHFLTQNIITVLNEHNGHWGSLRTRFTENAIKREMKRLSDRQVIRPWRNQWNIVHREDVVALALSKAEVCPPM